MNDDPSENEVFNTDWTSISEQEKAHIISKHLDFIELSRKAVAASSSYAANIRSLILMMLITLVGIIRSSDNKHIVLSIIGFQFLKTIFSRFFEVSVHTSANLSKKDLSDFLAKSSKRNKNA